MLALSDERDQWMRRLLDAERAAYALGYQDAVDDIERAGSEAWARRPLHRVAVGPARAELDKLRYPPDGRQSWIQGAA